MKPPTTLAGKPQMIFGVLRSNVKITKVLYGGTWNNHDATEVLGFIDLELDYADHIEEILNEIAHEVFHGLHIQEENNCLRIRLPFDELGLTDSSRSKYS